jgi:hypothetical protein
MIRLVIVACEVSLEVVKSIHISSFLVCCEVSESRTPQAYYYDFQTFFLQHKLNSIMVCLCASPPPLFRVESCHYNVPLSVV